MIFLPHFVSMKIPVMLDATGLSVSRWGRRGGFIRARLFRGGGMQTVDLLTVLQGLIVPSIVFVGGSIARYLKEISGELNGIKTAIAITTDRVDRHEDLLSTHDSRIRSLETGAV